MSVAHTTIICILLVATARGFVLSRGYGMGHQRKLGVRFEQQEQGVYIVPSIDEDQVADLFAWICRAFEGDPEYNNLVLAIAAVCGDLPEDSMPKQLAANARARLDPNKPEDTPRGEPFSEFERQSASLGAMGAGQWTGQWKTRPHALLDIKEMTDVEKDWVKTLSRGCRRTLGRALEQNYTVTKKIIRGGQPAPHSSLAHFKCVVDHEVRVIAGKDGNVQDFFDALAESVSRYLGTTRMTGEIYEYRDEDNKVIAIAHEVRKGRTARGQWFYATNDAAKRYVWFHSVYECVRRAIGTDGIDVVDLGPSGSDSSSDLKAKYGFVSVDDWPAVADYQGDFW